MRTSTRRTAAAALAAFGLCASAVVSAHAATPAASAATATPIKHIVVIFQENVSFDHYFATYPNALNNPAEVQQGTGLPASMFEAKPNTPKKINTLQNAGLLAPNNPNSLQPKRLTPSQAVTCDQDHDYKAEQLSYDGGKMDKFIETVNRPTCTTPNAYQSPELNLDYYDGNTVTGMWNYAQNYAMSDNAYSTTFGPSTPGAMNLISGQTHGVRSYNPITRQQTPTPDPYTVKSPNAQGVGTVTGDPDPVWDDCSSTKYPVAGMDGKNVGDLMNAKNVSWGWFQGGFRPTVPATATSRAVCGQSHTNVAGNVVTDYSPHHEPFQYYKSTANPTHAAPASVAEIGHNGQANHQYDLTDFEAVVNSDNMPAVSYLKAGMYQDGHPGYSDPLDEQHFLAKYINMIQQSKNWKDTAIVIAYDDSDGWYDHQYGPVLNGSHDPVNDGPWCLNSGVPAQGGYQDRCGVGPRQPLLVISPYSRVNFVDHTLSHQASIATFIEDNWGLGRIGDYSADAWPGSIYGLFDFQKAHAPQVIIDPMTGYVVSSTEPGNGKGNGNQIKPNDNSQGNNGNGQGNGNGNGQGNGQGNGNNGNAYGKQNGNNGNGNN